MEYSNYSKRSVAIMQLGSEAPVPFSGNPAPRHSTTPFFHRFVGFPWLYRI